jgi:hypothetical protein
MLFKSSVRTSKRTPHFTITKINWLTLFKFKYDIAGPSGRDVWGVGTDHLNAEIVGSNPA